MKDKPAQTVKTLMRRRETASDHGPYCLALSEYFEEDYQLGQWACFMFRISIFRISKVD